MCNGTPCRWSCSTRRCCSGEKSSVSPACGSRLSTTTTCAELAASAARSRGTSRCGRTEVYQEPGPRLTTSARAMAARTSGCTGGSAGVTRMDRTRSGLAAIATCPRMCRDRWGSSGSTVSTIATRSSGTSAIGSTRPRAPRRSARVSRARTASPPCISVSPVSTRLPTGCPASTPLPPSRCCSRVAISRVRGSSPASAASAIRRSPGGSTGISRRIRPEEPPSSATVTTAVNSPASGRQAASAAARPCPPPSATTDGPDAAGPDASGPGAAGPGAVVTRDPGRGDGRWR
ncbi:unannotated protein [freshwater metagenome]|uniref:Unannotated protein n=1 Tax=freshwater metagenome TaxID=449393 RepID=A0A6J7GRD3_9ZZZZ